MLLADVILIVHFLYVTFVVGSLPLIWFGAWLGWAFVRNRWFRCLHLGSILFVVIESLMGIVCPLTRWENVLRQTGSDASFVQRGLHAIMFYTVPEVVLTFIYVVFAALVVVTFKWVPLIPRARNR